MNTKLWKGRFTKAENSSAELLNASIFFDKRLYRQDIQGSMAHVNMLGQQGIIHMEDALLIRQTLQDLLMDIEEQGLEVDASFEDIHMLIESRLIERLGEVGKRVHTARSRNDQVATDLRLWQKDAIETILEQLRGIDKMLKQRSEEEHETLMPGFTHLQHAQPVSLGQHIGCWRQMLQRDGKRFLQCLEATDAMPLGSGALAGTTFPIDREMVAQELNFRHIIENSLDAVSDRDFVLDFLYAASTTMMHLSRICEELILWSTQEFSYLEMDDAFSTGSSIMPQKKNPDMAELIRGKSGRTFGHLMGLLVTLKGLPLTYNKDMQEDKEALFDAFDTLTNCLNVFHPMVESLNFHRERMAECTRDGFLNATDAADYLVKKGVSFRRAHEIIGKLVLECTNQEKKLEELTLLEWKRHSELFEEDIYRAIDPRERIKKTFPKKEAR